MEVCLPFRWQESSKCPPTPAECSCRLSRPEPSVDKEPQTVWYADAAMAVVGKCEHLMLLFYFNAFNTFFMTTSFTCYPFFLQQPIPFCSQCIDTWLQNYCSSQTSIQSQLSWTPGHKASVRPVSLLHNSSPLKSWSQKAAPTSWPLPPATGKPQCGEVTSEEKKPYVVLFLGCQVQ